MRDSARAATPHSELVRPGEEDERLTSEGVRILESWNVPRDPEVSIARARLLPGETTRWHYLVDTVERYLVVSGSGTVELGDRSPEAVGPGDVVVIPSETAQRIRCDGPEELVFYCVCTPRFQPSSYRDGKPPG
ncbi:MAG: cupin domain-containing protein [Gammaproteobacteria bacterium]